MNSSLNAQEHQNVHTKDFAAERIHMPQKPLRGFLAMLGKDSVRFFGGLASQATAVILLTSGHFIVRFYVDDAIARDAAASLFILIAVVYTAVAVVRGGFSFLTGRLSSASAEGVTRRLRNSLFDHLQKLSFRYHDKTQTGELIQRSTSDVDSIRRFYAEHMPEIARIILLAIVNFIALVVLSPQMAIFGTLVVPVIVVLSTLFFRKIFAAYDAYQDQDGVVSARVQENLSGVRVVRAFASQNFELQKFDEASSRKLRLGRELIKAEALYWPVSHALCALQVTGAIGVGAWLVMSEGPASITVGTLVAGTAMINQIVWPLQQLGRLITQLSTSVVSYGRIRELLVVDQEDAEERTAAEAAGDAATPGSADQPGGAAGGSTGSTALTRISGRIEVEDVHFSYDPGVPVLRGISFVVEPGRKIALLGETGSGKTTLVNLLPRFYEYESGSIRIDGQELSSLKRSFVRTHIGMVEQEAFLFSTTIRNNITYGVDREVSQEEVEAAARAASIHDSIMTFAKGYDTLVGERGVTLSGGQKQRIAIARTLLKDPEILILDDSTSAVDAETERNIQAALEELMKGRTTFIIAHRVQSLKSADQILVFKDGRIIQRGRHEELVQQDGFYRQVFDLQTKIEAELSQELLHA